MPFKRDPYAYSAFTPAEALAIFSRKVTDESFLERIQWLGWVCRAPAVCRWKRFRLPAYHRPEEFPLPPAVPAGVGPKARGECRIELPDVAARQQEIGVFRASEPMHAAHEPECLQQGAAREYMELGRHAVESTHNRLGEGPPCFRAAPEAEEPPTDREEPLPARKKPD